MGSKSFVLIHYFFEIKLKRFNQLELFRAKKRFIF